MHLNLNLPPNLRAGEFANFALVWHTPDSFTLDFAALVSPPDAQSGKAEAEVVARIRVPVSVIFKVAKAIAENVDNYEKVYGPITPGGVS